MIKKRLFLIPLLIPFLVALFYIVVVPGKVKSDAAEYDGLANSILQGEYSLDGKASMEREPGYPFFRATLKSISHNLTFIMLVQLILFCLTIYTVGIVWKQIDFKNGYFGFLGACFSYALAFYPSTHLSETLVAFLLSLFGLVLIKSIDTPSLKNWIFLSIISGIIVLTRYPYILIPLSFLLVLTFASINKNIEKKIIIKNFVLSFLLLTLFISPWIIRNYIKFDSLNFAGRSGAGFYARAWKADKSWRSLGDSYISAILGRGIIYTVYPNNQSIWLDQWGDWWRNAETIEKMWGDDPNQIDKKRKDEAKKIIFKDVNTFAKFIVWSGVDTLRFLQLANPIPEAHGSPFEGTYGELAKEKKINGIQIGGLAFVHIIQFFWFILILVSTYIGFKKYKLKYLPGIFFIAILLVHLVADNIPRYSAPLQPWLLSGIFMTTILPIYERYRNKQNRGESGDSSI